MGKTLKGIGASDGIALAKALILTEEKLNITNQKTTDTTAEIKKYHEAVEKTVSDIKKLITTSEKKFGPEKAAIFEAHQEIATDPEIKNDVEKLINDDKKTATMAVNEVMQKYFEIFKNMDDDYFKERASDVEDVKTRMLKHLLGIKIVDLSTIDEEVIIVADDLTPSQTAQLDKKYIKGFATNIGGRTSHAAIMARSLEIPAVLGLKTITTMAKNGEMIGLNGQSGEVMVDLSADDIKAFKQAEINFADEQEKLKTYINKESVTLDNHKVLVEANIGKPKDCVNANKYGAEGIGLFRSEFLYMENDHFPTEEEQFKAYKEAVEAMKPHMVVIRTLDIGGDKKLSYFTFPTEMNPFLGYRAIRFCLDNPEIFKTQLRALLRASAFGKLGIMFPMIATIDEFKQAKQMVEECKKELKTKSIAFDEDIQVGMMVEIPAAAINAENFAKYADFFSIGTNDLIQYSMAADRMNQQVSYLYQPTNPSILNLINMTIQGGHKYNRWVGMCGEMAGDKTAIPLLLGMGLDAFSMSAPSIPKARMVIDNLKYSDAKVLATEALKQETSQQVQQLVNEFLNKNNL
ncbi:phosphoenolpyruvate--protein phosphotransferase [Mesoplasma lactucae]|uniref:Phosphoenolpyruvate-protein phosphotransferase n=1 Tax=Mesoplasma lactucae ATCC 49193 TaxID=81460 RepID=A0A291IR30_9MOLU|nr:phosphoenolpyruvate--protein phosphotransferase [Mesoplasma lactucae]ATG97233.1 phosphoenolpyruvate--protein phosphotransferase [Mesoplasma lactucae ATCC 49193]ATZ20324.1 phosphoenolpyruvate-protein phosphotransferase [Mesoplasma lactucae ATCC 49193]MCL8216495.1 Phosphoenolpyruvate-protein phosphotransferase [Mesoplasma lactucae ATCC 49193]